VSSAIFVGGTASNVGKSWMATAICRTLFRRGFRVAPFKAQNMSNNSFPCLGGGEIGRSQVAQAEACGLEPEPAMNPVLLKPTGDSSSQVILHGKVWKTVHANEYYEHAPFLRQEALTAYEDLARRFDVVVLEGAGSVAEINLWGRDFTNLSMAEAVQARCLLVSDIDRGGVFASILGTLDLLPPAYRSLIASFAVNRFRGDRALFADGVSMLENRSQLPCLGLFPFVQDVHVDAEDSLASLSRGINDAGNPHPNIAILRFPRLSNTTDFRLAARRLAGASQLQALSIHHFAGNEIHRGRSGLAAIVRLRFLALAAAFGRRVFARNLRWLSDARQEHRRSRRSRRRPRLCSGVRSAAGADRDGAGEKHAHSSRPNSGRNALSGL